MSNVPNWPGTSELTSVRRGHPQVMVFTRARCGHVVMAKGADNNPDTAKARIKARTNAQRKLAVKVARHGNHPEKKA